MINTLFSPWDYKKVFHAKLKYKDCYEGKIVLYYDQGSIDLTFDSDRKLRFHINTENSVWGKALSRLLHINREKIKQKDFERIYRKTVQEKQKIDLHYDTIEKDFEKLYEDDLFLMQFPDTKYFYFRETPLLKIPNTSDFYIHIPFCNRKCFYCDFAVLANTKKITIQKYLKGIKKEMRFVLSQRKNARTLYIGGGTPSCLSEKQIYELFDLINKHLLFEKETEITFEGNPGSLGKEKIHLLQKFGVNRFSVGVQSFQKGVLEKFGRTDTVKHIQKCLKNLREYTENFNVDIIYGFNGQTEEMLIKDLKTLLSYKPSHITLYPLFIKKNSFAEKKLKKMPLNDIYKLYLAGSTFLREYGYYQYAKEYFVRDKKYIHQYQDNYLQGKDVYGFGLRSRSYLKGSYYINPGVLKEYYKMIDEGKMRRLTYTLNKKERLIKDLIMAIKRNYLDCTEMNKNYHVDIQTIYNSLISCLQKKGWMNKKGSILKLTNEGMFFDNYIARGVI